MLDADYRTDTFTPLDADPNRLVESGYAKGVPMGGTLDRLAASPVFYVAALKDPQGANLDRVQIIKGWVDAAGAHHEKIYNVAWSGDRKIGPDGKLPAVGTSVSLKTATYTNSIGSADLMSSWIDPDFDPKVRALYYARVLEIPTPRWTTYKAVANEAQLLPNVAATIQERAWSSPIWYTP